VFDEEPVRGFDGDKEMEIKLEYKNEYGGACELFITGACVLTVQGGTAVDDVVSERQVIMMARNVSRLVKTS
jgi:hypothetical protein